MVGLKSWMDLLSLSACERRVASPCRRIFVLRRRRKMMHEARGSRLSSEIEAVKQHLF